MVKDGRSDVAGVIQPGWHSRWPGRRSVPDERQGSLPDDRRHVHVPGSQRRRPGSVQGLPDETLSGRRHRPSQQLHVIACHRVTLIPPLYKCDNQFTSSHWWQACIYDNSSRHILVSCMSIYVIVFTTSVYMIIRIVILMTSI